MNERKLRVKALFFDLDGTLVDSKKAYSTALKTALSKMGKQNAFNASLAIDIPKRLEQNLPITDMIPGVDTNTFLEHYLNAYYETTAAQARPIPDISNVLDKLSHGFKTALITMRNVPKEKVIEELAGFNLVDYFQCIVTAFDPHDHKPFSRALVKCAKELNIRISQCAVIGDSVANIRAGKSAGTKTVAVLSGIFSRQELEKEKPDLVIDSVIDLPDYLE